MPISTPCETLHETTTVMVRVGPGVAGTSSLKMRGPLTPPPEMMLMKLWPDVFAVTRRVKFCAAPTYQGSTYPPENSEVAFRTAVGAVAV
jgi:hypothetical protein